jgi:predicted ester cyclase
LEATPEPLEVFLRSVNAHDTLALNGSLAPDFVFEEVAGPGAPSRDALSAELGMLYAAFPDLHFRIVRISEEEGRRFLEFQAIGTHEGEFLGVAPTKAFTIASGGFNLEADEEFIHRLRLTLDFGGLRRQLLIADQGEATG